jgi:hypothetical protein
MSGALQVVSSWVRRDESGALSIRRTFPDGEPGEWALACVACWYSATPSQLLVRTGRQLRSGRVLGRPEMVLSPRELDVLLASHERLEPWIGAPVQPWPPVLAGGEGVAHG